MDIDSEALEREILVISSKSDELSKVEKLANRVSQKVTLSEEKSDNLAIVITELVNNAILHGNKSQPHKSVTITVTYYRDHITVAVKDEGNGFDPAQLRDPRDPENIWRENGRGIFLVRHLVDDVQFKPSSGGMEIIITQYFD